MQNQTKTHMTVTRFELARETHHGLRIQDLNVTP